MAAKQFIQTRFNLPSSFNDSQRQRAGNMIVDTIKERTRSGINKDGKQFPGYTKEYKQSLDFRIAGKSAKPNLSLTGDMLSDLAVLEHGPGYVIVGYPTDYENAGQVEGNVRGTYGNESPIPGKARPFIGLPQSVLDQIIAEVRIDSVEVNTDAIVAGVLAQLGL